MRSGVAVCCLGLACDSSNYVDLPPHDGMSSLLLISDGRRVFVSAHRLDGRPIELALERRSTLTALLYRATLDDLGLAEGDVRPGDPTECGARPLPASDGRYGATVGDGAFQLLDELPRSVADIRIGGDCPCLSFAIERRFEIHATFAGLALQTDADHLTAYGHTNAEGQSVAVRTSLVDFEEIVVASSTGAIVPNSGVFGPGGQVWLGTSQGRLYHGPAEGPLVWMQTPSIGVIGGLDGSGVSEPLEVWFVTTKAEVFRFDGTSFERPFLDEHPSTGTKQVGVVVRRSASEVYGGLSDRQGIFFFDGEGVSVEDVGDWARAMRFVPALDGVVIGMWSGNFHRLMDGRRDELAGAGGLPPVRILPSDDGFLFVDSDIEIGQYVDGYGFCADRLAGLGLSRAFGFERIRDRLLLIGAKGAGTEVVVLRTDG